MNIYLIFYKYNDIEYLHTYLFANTKKEAIKYFRDKNNNCEILFITKVKR